MNATMPRRTLLAALAALAAGCANTGGLQAQLRSGRAELMYLQDPPVAERQPSTVGLGKVTVEAALPAETTLEKVGGFPVPLLFVNFWKYDYRASLGTARLANDLPGFTRQSLAEALRRGARYAWAEEGADLQVEATVRTVTLRAPMQQSGNFLFLVFAWSWSSSVGAGPAEAIVEGEVVLRRGGQEVLRRPVKGQARTGVLQGAHAKVEDYTSTMAEAVSLAVKDFDAQVVAAVNGI